MGKGSVVGSTIDSVVSRLALVGTQGRIATQLSILVMNKP